MHPTCEGLEIVLVVQLITLYCNKVKGFKNVWMVFMKFNTNNFFQLELTAAGVTVLRKNGYV